ncbi:unnamed protein product [Durusdinium trenchii]|uniref:Methyltransferase FkbM domain-containing protein n=1 Tax=Durusdinium trenchii TaxID=1381693 RepID=A0ABP0RAQ4_9DINO
MVTHVGPRILDQYHAPPEIDWLSLDVEGAELEVLQPLFHDATSRWKVDVISMEARAADVIAKLHFMGQNDYQLMDRIGDDIYVSTWSALETSCGRPPAAQRLTPRFALERVQERIRRKEWINETERRTFLRLAQLAEERHCKAESLSYLLWSTLLSLDAANLVCRGDGFMNETALYLKLAPLTFDDCSPFFALPLSRMDFVLVLMTRWPIFEELQLLSERLASRENNFGNEGCDLYRRDLPPPDFLLNVWPPRLRDTTLMCGGLRLALVYLEKVLQLQGHAPGRNLTNFWKKSVRVAERSLKSLAYRFGIAELLGAIGELPQSKSPWVVLKRIQRTWW